MANKGIEEAIRVVLETEGAEGVVALRKVLAQLGDTSGVSAEKAEALSGELQKLADTSTNIRNYTLLKSTLTDTGIALGKAKDKLSTLRTEFALAEKPTKSMETALGRAERQVETLTRAQNKQTADLARTTGALNKAGVDTNKLATEYARLQGEFGEFSRKADAAAGAMARTAKESKSAAAGVGSLDKAAKASSISLAAIASRLTLVSGAAVAAVKALASISGAALFTGAIKSATSLEDALQQVRAVSSATAEEMAALKVAAEIGGAATRFSALEAAEGLGELARATGSAQGAIAALPAALDLAQGAGIGVADAAQFITTTLTQFGLGAEQASRVADVLAHTANTTQADVRGLGDALSYAAPLANQLGLDTEKTVAIIGELAEQGYRGERAGTALRNVFSEMLDPASAFGKALRDLGIESSDFATVIVGLAKAGDRGKDAMLQLDAAARPAILSLVNSGGAALQQLETDLRSAGGAAAETAKLMGDSVAGANESIRDTFDRTRRSLVEPLLEPLKNELFELANELEAFAGSPEFEEIKGALKELFVEGAQAARELFQEIDFKQLAVDIRTFIGDANQTVTEFRENLTLIVSAVEIVGESFSVVFNAVQTIVLGLAAAVAKVLEISLKLQKVVTWLPRTMTEMATGTTHATDQLNEQIGGLAAVYDEFAARTGQNLHETVEATKELAGVSQVAGASVAAGMASVAESTDAASAATKRQAAASREASDALESQAAASGSAAAAASASATEMDAAAERLKKAFTDLGLTSQVNLERAAESAKKNFNLIRDAIGQGHATAEDARRAFTAYAQAARAAVADSDASTRARVENELTVQESILNASRSLEDMGAAGERAGSRVARGASQAAGALDSVASSASGAANSTEGAGNAAGDADEDFIKATEGAFGLAAGLGAISEKANEAYAAVGQATLNRALGMTTGTQLGGDHPLNRITDLIREQVAAFNQDIEAVERLQKAFDPLAKRREELAKKYDFLGSDRIEQMLQTEQRLKASQKARNDEQARINEEQREQDLRRLDVAKEETKAATALSGVTTTESDRTVVIRFDLPEKSLATAASAAEAEFVERLAVLLLPKLMKQLERARSVSLRATRGRR